MMMIAEIRSAVRCKSNWPTKAHYGSDYINQF
uniref:Uncharacterized protein n=1 Tax=Setaria italica TaxID=4555 RepID=K3Y4H4_SETIT